MTDFKTLGLAETVLRAVTSEGYDTPTPIQAKAIPLVLEGRDVVGIAQTGTGKTAAFVLPLLSRLAELGGTAKPKGTRVLVLSPTRELAAQIHDAVRAYGKNVRPRSTVVVGGAKPGPQIRACAQGLDFLVATPGRLLDHIGTGAIKLTDTAVVVLDEADQMLDLGFMPAVRRILAMTPKTRQTVLFSATMPNQIRALADDFLTDPVEIAVTPASTPIERIQQSVVQVARAEKRNALARILADEAVRRAIVFTRTKRGADRVARHLASAGLASEAIHGDKSQGQRERALDAFKTGKSNILVATDIAARGIDVDGVTHVVNYELPNVPESYVHRIGRTARAGAEGVAVSLVDEEEMELLGDIERLIGRSLITGEAIDRDAPKPRAAGSGKAKRSRRRGGGSRTQQTAGGEGRPQQSRGEGRPQQSHGESRPKQVGGARAQQSNGDGRQKPAAKSDGRPKQAPKSNTRPNQPNGGDARPKRSGGEALDAGVARIAGGTPRGGKQQKGFRSPAPVRA
ncbi:MULTISPECIES: DEAD/DEAH box helicase [Thalassobaculum]|uniref:ATP-dependent RNA helicase RhlE n=1 Tax=Thalassobaculum litoreum DSM 18839 TaxID=1123362 RepID=A0A8G2BJ07_9PROT|nr:MULTISPECIES: DEAD/DEAH box helicase [Thalassobaculum]SDF97357.1 ATP-dependent RNA helicase RhlE [Thalassobaculum litoreum DSM 18839]